MGIAHELITRGWTRGRNQADDGSVCLVGAALASEGKNVDAGFDYSLNPETRDALVRAIWASGTEYPTGQDGKPIIFWWNDNREDFDEVLRVAKEADEILDGQANA